MMQLQDFLSALLNRAKAEGLEPCEAYISSSDSFEASVNKGEIIDYNVAESLGISFRALIEGKMGYASTQALDEAAVDMLIEGAKANAALIENDDEQFIYEGDADYPARDVYNPALDHITPTDKIAMVKRLEQLTMDADSRIAQTEACVVMSGGSMIRIVNSYGLDVSHEDNMLLAASMPVAKDGEKVNSGMAFRAVRDAEKLDLDAIAKEAAEDAASGLEARPVPSGSYKIALQNNAATALLGVFAGVFSADSAQKGLSLLKGREGDKIASDAVTLMDDPFHELGFAGAPFDAEGVRSEKKAVIEGGVLKTLLHNLKTAKKQGLAKSTGNASKGSYQSPIGVAPANFFFAPGEKDMDALLSDMGDGLLITELQGLHAGANGISGDFSLSAKGFVVEGGTKGRAVSQITLSGNFYRLIEDVEDVANDLWFTFPSSTHCGSPTMLIKSLSVAGE